MHPDRMRGRVGLKGVHARREVEVEEEVVLVN
jgi:hypothetical protein